MDKTVKLLSVGDAARILDRSPDAVRNYERTGKLKAFRTGNGKGMRLFSESDVSALAAVLHAKKHKWVKGSK